MTIENASSDATDKLALLADTATTARWWMERRIDSIMDLLSHDGDWLGDPADATEVAELTALIKALDNAVEAAEPADERDVQLVDIELPSGATFTTYMKKDVAEELKRCLDRLTSKTKEEAQLRLATAKANIAEAEAAASLTPSFEAAFAHSLRGYANGMELFGAANGGLNALGKSVVEAMHRRADGIDPPKPTAVDPEAQAIAEFARQDEARGVKMHFSFVVDPMHGSTFTVKGALPRGNVDIKGAAADFEQNLAALLTHINCEAAA